MLLGRRWIWRQCFQVYSLFVFRYRQDRRQYLKGYLERTAQNRRAGPRAISRRRMGWHSYVVTSKVVNVAFAQHRVVLKFRL